MTHGTVSGYKHHGCRCDDCRAAKNAYIRERGYERRSLNLDRAEQKRRWDRGNRPFCACGRRMHRTAKCCAACVANAAAARKMNWLELRRSGLSNLEIADRVGVTPQVVAGVFRRLKRSGVDVPRSSYKKRSAVEGTLS